MVPQRADAQGFRIEVADRPEPARLERLAYTYKEVASLLSVSVVTIKRMVRDGEIATVSIRDAKRITAETVRELLQSGQD